MARRTRQGTDVDEGDLATHVCGLLARHRQFGDGELHSVVVTVDESTPVKADFAAVPRGDEQDQDEKPEDGPRLGHGPNDPRQDKNTLDSDAVQFVPCGHAMPFA
ncbi:MAG: hypothetical protein NTY19_08155 [Planctomycetota bacterium]|nr:hypothetical protein [Planctomycetota bacterium]